MRTQHLCQVGLWPLDGHNGHRVVSKGEGVHHKRLCTLDIQAHIVDAARRFGRFEDVCKGHGLHSEICGQLLVPSIHTFRRVHWHFLMVSLLRDYAAEPVVIHELNLAIRVGHRHCDQVT